MLWCWFFEWKFGDLMWFWCDFVAWSLMFFFLYVYIIYIYKYILTFWKNLERYSDSEVRAALGWDRKTDSGRLGSIFAACAGRQISFPKLSLVNGEEWWKCKNTSPIFLGCCQFTKLSRRLDKYNDRFSPSAVGKLFFDTSIPRLQLIWCYTCPWHVEGFMYGHHPTWVNHCNHFHSICIPFNHPSQILFPLL